MRLTSSGREANRGRGVNVDLVSNEPMPASTRLRCRPSWLTGPTQRAPLVDSHRASSISQARACSIGGPIALRVIIWNAGFGVMP